MTSLRDFSTNLESEIKTRDYFQFVSNAIKKTVKQDDSLITQILCTGLSARTSEPLNLAVMAPTSEGKTYPVIQTMGYFPTDQVWYVGKMSPKTLIRMRGELIDGRSGQSIGRDVKRLRLEISLLGSSKADKQKKASLLNELDALLESSKTVIDLSGKIMVFLEPPDEILWEIIKPILSHDKDEIDYPYVSKDDMVTKSVLIRGQPACIFCSAKDESSWPQWPEIASRFLITSPNMVQQKYLESNILIAQKAGLPKTLQQDVIISDKEVELAKECIIHIEDQMARFSGVWIPYLNILANALPDEIGTDSRATKRIFSLMRILPLVRSELRPRLSYGDENLVIATLEDLGEVLRLTKNTSNIPVYKMRFIDDIFSPCCSDIGGESKMVTSRQLCDYLKDRTGSTISTDNLKKTYLNELLNNGVIEQYDNEDPATGRPKRDKLYGPLIVNVNLNLSNWSNSGQLDNNLHEYALAVSKKFILIPERWLEFEVMALSNHRIQNDKIRLFFMNGKKDEFVDIDAKEGKSEEMSQQWAEISIQDFCQNYEKNDKLIRYFLMDNSCNKHVVLYDNMQELPFG